MSQPACRCLVPDAYIRDPKAVNPTHDSLQYPSSSHEGTFRTESGVLWTGYWILEENMILCTEYSYQPTQSPSLRKEDDKKHRETCLLETKTGPLDLSNAEIKIGTAARPITPFS
ncbi:hypothetical protein H105_08458 [Trichophyton soudanense CBS 452.61]|uniref:Uncharacterized protein n=1 Tax=Trichophyton soudanense CBS 452.61 TaxID=1215331 RepID=A0A022XE97_TRISD|nr:hypothetical protein H105_08458 [Trichophyton soudanense CBS 452.61]